MLVADSLFYFPEGLFKKVKMLMDVYGKAVLVF